MGALSLRSLGRGQLGRPPNATDEELQCSRGCEEINHEGMWKGRARACSGQVQPRTGRDGACYTNVSQHWQVRKQQGP